jgi:nucleoside-diphosphate-sugar epimerase
MNDTIPTLLVTGASGFIGRHFVIAMNRRYRLFCLARRTQKEAGVPFYENIIWMQGDICDSQQMDQIAEHIRSMGGADFVLHLAGYYDFHLKDNPAYEQTNVIGTQNILELASQIGARRFIFSSSLAACEFTSPGEVITEHSPANAQFPYALSKKKAESLIIQNSERLPASIVRLAAVFSDWCEYPPLYVMLETWLSRGWQARIIGGRGEFSLPYIHVRDVIAIFDKIIERHENLSGSGIYNASYSNCVSHNELYQAATKYYFAREKRPLHLPRWFVYFGLFARLYLWKLRGREPFERPWMAQYIDKELNVDASETYRALDWKPSPRHTILRRLLFIIENKKIHPSNWHFRNQVLIKQRVAFRKSILIYRVMWELRDRVIEDLFQEIRNPENHDYFPNYQNMEEELLRWYINLVYQLFAVSIRNRDRSFFTEYNQIICPYRFVGGFKKEEIVNFLLSFEKILHDTLLTRSEMKSLQDRIYNYITLTMQFAIDEIEDMYELMEQEKVEKNTYKVHADQKEVLSSEDLQRLVRRLEHVCGDPFQTSV